MVLPILSRRPLLRQVVVRDEAHRVARGDAGVVVVTRVSLETLLTVIAGWELVSTVPYIPAARLRIVAETGAFHLTGMDVRLRRSLVAGAATGVFVVAGGTVRLLLARALRPGPAGYAVAGADVALLAHRRMVAEAGAFGLEGQSAGMGVVRAMPAGTGAFALGGENVDLIASRRVEAAVVGFLLAGGAANLVASRRIAAGAGAFALSGMAAGMSASRRLAAASGAFAVTGQAAGLRASRRVAADAGAYAVAGQDAGLRVARRMPVAAAAFALAGQAAALKASRRIVAATGAFALTGVATVPAVLDPLDNVYGAYALKRVLSIYTGPLVRLRRVSDNVEADFLPASDGWISASAITTWLGGSSARVARVYDQSGNGRNLAQTTAGAQPLLDLSASHPRLHFTRTTPEHLPGNTALAAYARNIAAVTLVHVGIMDVNTTDDQYAMFVSNGVANTQPRVAYGIGINDNIGAFLHRRTDAAGTGFLNINWTDTTTWVTAQARIDFSGGTKRLRMNTTVANTTFTGGLSSDTDAIATGWGSRSGVDQGANMKATAFFLIRDALSDAELDALYAACEDLKAA